MNKKILIVLAVLFVGIGLIGTVMALEATNNSITENNANQTTLQNCNWFHHRKALTEEQKTQLEEQRALMEQKREQLEKIFTSGTFEEFQAFMAENNLPILKRFAEKITAENWPLVQELHKNMQRNREIMQELGFKQGNEKGFGFGMRREMHKIKAMNCNVIAVIQ